MAIAPILNANILFIDELYDGFLHKYTSINVIEHMLD
jgi:hypothetical protein